VVDQWCGLGAYKSEDGEKWVRNGIILDEGGHREDDGTIGLHADVHVQGENAYIFYFTHPDRNKDMDEQSYKSKRSSLQVAKLDIQNDILICDRNAIFNLVL
jgi:hypothetical protein